ncbi:glycoside hydrolase family 31 protein [Spirochaeta lutea]|uniref:glycoside hydrolase family 31 protein n=1 Tax=Spirochaeta lutea TaxID=1480694 RepID=UPI000690A8B6|nr:glycoside hydrolase family 31 protein [Spirochaeta lutea]
MYFHKIDHPFNFSPSAQPEIEPLAEFGPDVFQVAISVPGAESPGLESQLGDLPRRQGDAEVQTGGEEGRFRLEHSDAQGLILRHSSGAPVLNSHPVLPYGTSGQKWMFSFRLGGIEGFYGMGEKNIGFEKSRIRTKFWNTDVWADFAGPEVESGTTDPMYASFPVLILRSGGYWIAFIISGGYPAFMDTGAKQVIEGVKDPGVDLDFFYLGATGPEDRKGRCILAAAESLEELIPRINRIAGLPRRFPLWALGYHQSRWGYGSLDDLEELSGRFTRENIPCDGLWLDIDYMHEYRVFTLNTTGFIGAEQRLLALGQTGRRVVPILDPALKREEGNPLVEEARTGGLFSLNPSGKPYVGFVWPGASYFPDFSLPETRAWWSRNAADLAARGFAGFWVDMNDPSTGSSSVDDMLFSRGSIPHEAYHNDYARDMTRATMEGLARAYPDRRPFVLSRSGSLGSSRWGALWTGDNMSNYHHLNKGIEMVLSLSLSGMPMAGMDVGGFGGDCTAELSLDWHRAAFLFPIYRNHSASGTAPQEPWQFDRRTLGEISQAIRARYTFLPYLYQLMIRYTSAGEPLIRPMIYGSFNPDTAHCADQYYIGPHLIQAPKLSAGQKTRAINLPPGDWAGIFTPHELSGPETAEISLDEHPFPVYLKAGVLLPIQPWREDIQSSDQVALSNPGFVLYPGGLDDGVPAGQPILETGEYILDEPDGWKYTRHQEGIRWRVGSTAEGMEITLESGSLAGQEFDFYLWARRTSVLCNGSPVVFKPGKNPVPGSQVPVWKARIRV